MSDNNTSQVIVRATPEATEEAMRQEMQRRFAREDQNAAIDVLAYRRREELESRIKTLSDRAGELRKKAHDLDNRIDDLAKGYSDHLDLSPLEKAADALNNAGLADDGFVFEVNVTSANVDDGERTVVYTVKVQATSQKNPDEHRRYNYSARSVGRDVKHTRSFDDIDGLPEAHDELVRTNKLLKQIEEQIQTDRELQIKLPRFREDLKVQLATRQLRYTSGGQKILEMLESQVTHGLNPLQLELKD